MKGTPDRRRISSQILVINCQSAAGGDIVRIKHGCILCLVQLALMAHKSFQQQLGSFGPERPFRCLDNRTLPRLSCSSHLAQKLC